MESLSQSSHISIPGEEKKKHSKKLMIIFDRHNKVITESISTHKTPLIQRCFTSCANKRSCPQIGSSRVRRTSSRAKMFRWSKISARSPAAGHRRGNAMAWSKYKLGGPKKRHEKCWFLQCLRTSWQEFHTKTEDTPTCYKAPVSCFPQNSCAPSPIFSMLGSADSDLSG